VHNASCVPRVSHLLSGERPKFGEILETLSRKGNIDAVVFVHARQIGTQQLNYYGQSSTLYTVELGVRTYSVGNQRMLGSGWSEQVNFTSLNAAEKAREAVEPMLHGVEEKLVDYRPAHPKG